MLWRSRSRHSESYAPRSLSVTRASGGSPATDLVFMPRLLVLVVVLMSLLASIHAVRAQKIVYVATDTGADHDNCGDYPAPCQTLIYAAKKTQTGDVLKLFPGTFYGEKNFPLDLTNRATSIVSAVPRAAVIRCRSAIDLKWCIRFSTDQSPDNFDSLPLYQLRDLLFTDFDAVDLILFGSEPQNRTLPHFPRSRAHQTQVARNHVAPVGSLRVDRSGSMSSQRLKRAETLPSTTPLALERDADVWSPPHELALNASALVSGCVFIYPQQHTGRMISSYVDLTMVASLFELIHTTKELIQLYGLESHLRNCTFTNVTAPQLLNCVRGSSSTQNTLLLEDVDFYSVHADVMISADLDTFSLDGVEFSGSSGSLISLQNAVSVHVTDVRVQNSSSSLGPNSPFMEVFGASAQTCTMNLQSVHVSSVVQPVNGSTFVLTDACSLSVAEVSIAPNSFLSLVSTRGGGTPGQDLHLVNVSLFEATTDDVWPAVNWSSSQFEASVSNCHLGRMHFHEPTATGSITLTSSQFFVPSHVDDGGSAIVSVESLGVSVQVSNCSFEELGSQEYNAFSCPPCGHNEHCTTVTFDSKNPSTFYGISIANDDTCELDCSHGACVTKELADSDEFNLPALIAVVSTVGAVIVLVALIALGNHFYQKRKKRTDAYEPINGV
eukprot:CAMPEP_0174244438 /NCGR_PEP_ID=MMETSP0417-20130205/35262_1 /TAXON_ID=242541 /ORGANISM="Mayorella sp, Strain BSH-02190019" /LENGTH=665 /DNA_ID=CAMNT_0015324123 /DNA_START=93 /DNA_END=2090 /DNA_ORIENTATION=-